MLIENLLLPPIVPREDVTLNYLSFLRRCVPSPSRKRRPGQPGPGESAWQLSNFTVGWPVFGAVMNSNDIFLASS
jgi:hypothetical protein